ncbi:MAG: hypothetical protein QN152_09080 [Armatimonadota bacterium]|nr:hypothetical protein [Armatimonadota bacterium]MDR7427288.1 hypothetical protein [Armatimonadota bacterium]MDR7463138.1 hypothetical protein [Armatimonadota bacterium]MDR7468875.1 hypothetical protein [Armatimonadota bacterium]MDR7474884.1 hypothetical protein [Armatimonadota bacterium]
MRTLLSWAAFAAAVYAFSGLWAAFRGALQGRPTVSPAPFLGLVALFLISMAYLAFVVYAADRGAGRVRRRIALFERILDRGQHG